MEITDAGAEICDMRPTDAPQSPKTLHKLQATCVDNQTIHTTGQSDLTLQTHEAIQSQQCVKPADWTGETDQLDICIDTESLTLNDSLKSRLINHVAKSDAHFRHQQRGEPDLSYQEKCKIAEDFLNRSASVFLSRFGKYLDMEDLQYFDKMSDSYEVNFFLNELKKQKSMSYCKNRVKNRRYKALKQLVSEGTYFSYDEMKFRDPYLYEQMVGKYLTNEEIAEQVDKADMRLSSILMKHMQQQEENYLYFQQQQKEETQLVEEDDSEEEEEMEDEYKGEKAESVSDEMRQELREEFVKIMQERFLSGEDKDFNYRDVDENAEYDDLDQLDKDEEEKYFNEDEKNEEKYFDEDEDDNVCDISDP